MIWNDFAHGSHGRKPPLSRITLSSGQNRYLKTSLRQRVYIANFESVAVWFETVSLTVFFKWITIYRRCIFLSYHPHFPKFPAYQFPLSSRGKCIRVNICRRWIPCVAAYCRSLAQRKFDPSYLLYPNQQRSWRFWWLFEQKRAVLEHKHVMNRKISLW